MATSLRTRTQQGGTPDGASAEPGDRLLVPAGGVVVADLVDTTCVIQPAELAAPAVGGGAAKYADNGGACFR